MTKSKNKSKPLVVFINDPMGCMNRTAGEEYDEFASHILEMLDNKVTIQHSFNLTRDNKHGVPLRASVVVYDYGGMMFGCEDLLTSNAREIIKLAQENPSLLFIIYSSISWVQQITHEMREMGLNQDDFPNVIQGKSVSEQIAEWLQLTQTKAHKKKLDMPTSTYLRFQR